MSAKIQELIAKAERLFEGAKGPGVSAQTITDLEEAQALAWEAAELAADCSSLWGDADECLYQIGKRLTYARSCIPSRNTRERRYSDDESPDPMRYERELSDRASDFWQH
jgi:hypothetical protein